MIEHNIECGTGMTPEQKHAVDCLGKVMGDVDESGDMLWKIGRASCRERV